MATNLRTPLEQFDGLLDPARSMDFYAVLKVAQDASTTDIRHAYRQAVLQAHPDRGGNSEAFCLVTKAFETLSDPAQRSFYDRDLQRCIQQSNAGSCSRKRPKRRADEHFSGKGKEAVENDSLANLHQVLRAMGKPAREQAICQMEEGVRAALLSFMKEARLEPARCDEPVHTVASSSLRLRSFRDSAGREKFSVQLDVDCLRAYTRQVPLEEAVAHQLVLSDLKEALLKADAMHWRPPFKIRELFRNVLLFHETTIDKLGLRVFLQMRASEWIPNVYCLTSPVTCFDETVALRHRLLNARATSWEQLRQEWVALLQLGKHSMTAADASMHADKAREEFLRRQLAQAIASVQKSLSRAKELAAQTCRRRTASMEMKKGSNSKCLTAAALKEHNAACSWAS